MSTRATTPRQTTSVSLAYVRHMPEDGDRMNTERQVRLFRNGRNQALRIPRDFELPRRTATLPKEGPALIVGPGGGASPLWCARKAKAARRGIPADFASSGRTR